MAQTANFGPRLRTVQLVALTSDHENSYSLLRTLHRTDAQDVQDGTTTISTTIADLFGERIEQGSALCRPRTSAGVSWSILHL